MKNVSTNKNWLLVNIQTHMEPPSITLIKNELEVNNSESDCIKVKLCRNPASAASDMYEYKVALFEND